MEIKAVTYKRKRPMEQFGHEEFEVYSDLSPNDNAEDCMNKVRFLVNKIMGGPTQMDKQVPVEAVQKPASTDVEPAKTQTDEPKKSRSKKPVLEKVEVSNTQQQAKVDEPKPETMPTVDVPAKKEDAPKVETPAPSFKKVRGADTVYDRNLEVHKTLFRTILDELVPNWQVTHREKARDISIALEGVPFLNNEGGVLPEFKSKVKLQLEEK